MTAFTIELDKEAIREATQQAIMATLVPEAREKILQAAVSNLLNTSNNTYGRTSQLEDAFQRAVLSVAQQEASRLVGEDSVLRKRIEDLLRTVADKVLSADVDKLTDRMAEAFAASMRKDY